MFDFLTERGFYMELEAVIPGRRVDKPVCTKSRGKAPEQQVDFEEFEQKAEKAAKKVAAALDLDDSLYGDSEFDEDELAEGGFNDDSDFGGGSGFGSNPFDDDF